MWTALLAALAVQATATQPPADELLDDRGFLAALAELEGSPRVRTEVVGRSHHGRPVFLIAVGPPEAIARLAEHRSKAAERLVPRIENPSLGAPRFMEPTEIGEDDALLPVLFAGDSWGHEAAQVEGLLKAARTLAFEDTGEVRAILSRTIALFVPLMNPDGRALALEEWRKTPLSSGDSGAGNAYGFLLNRDFVHGTQPESRAVIRTVLGWRPVVVIDQHEDMYHLGAQMAEVAFVEPFVPGFDVEEHPATRAATVDLGSAIAARWRELGFPVLFDPEGDNRFAPLPERGRGIGPVASSAGRLNLMCTLHGITSFITESARTPGSQSWEDRVEQKSSAALATLLEVASRPERYARVVYERKLAAARRGGSEFLIVPERDQPRDGLEALLEVLQLHRIAVYRVADPYPAFVVPLAQAEAEMARHLLAPERSRLNEVAPALGLRTVASESLSGAEREAFTRTKLQPAVLLPPPQPATDAPAYTARPGISSTALANRILADGLGSVRRSEGFYRFEGDAASILWQAARLGVALEGAGGSSSSPDPRIPRVPRVAIYSGQGVSKQDAGEIAWALDEGGFPYVLLDERSLPGLGALGAVDALIVPNGSAREILEGWDPNAANRRPPWQIAEPSRGIGREGLRAIERFVREGGAYIGLGGGGAQLAGSEFLGLTRLEMLPSSVGLGQVRLDPLQPESPLLFGYGAGSIPAFFFAPPGSSDRGFVFRAGPSSVAAYAGVVHYPPEMSFVSTEILSADSSHAAIARESHGRGGQIVLFGIAPVFRGQWKSSFLLLYNALYSGVLEADRE